MTTPGPAAETAPETYPAMLAELGAALEDLRRRREAVPAAVAAWSEQRRRDHPPRRFDDGWPDDEE